MRRLIRDVSRVDTTTVLFIGLSAGVLTSFVMFAFWGELIAGSTDSFGVQLGLFTYLLVSVFFGWMYAFVFRSAHRSGLFAGLQLALFHWLIMGFAVGFLPPGPFAIRAGFQAAIAFFVAHLTFGGLVGVFFDRAAIRFDYPRPITGPADAEMDDVMSRDEARQRLSSPHLR